MKQALKTTQNIPEDDRVYSSQRYSDEPEMENYFHLQQMILLIKCLDWLWSERKDYYASGNQTIYYSPQHKKNEFFRGPDFFVVLNTEKRPRNSWVVWEEQGKYPNVIVELLSESTASVDKKQKKEIYQNIFKTPNYFWFSCDNLELAGWKLVEGKYQKIEPNEQGLLWSEELQLYLGVYEKELRFFTSAGSLVPTVEEDSISQRREKEQERREKEQERREKEQERREKEIAQQQAQQERREKEIAQQQAQQERREKELAQQQIEQERLQTQQERLQKEKLAAKLRELGIEPDNL